MTFEQKKARAIALMDSKKMWRSRPFLCRILWLGHRFLAATALDWRVGADEAYGTYDCGDITILVYLLGAVRNGGR